jgi:hypothetical protein
MQSTESINELATALAKAQGEITGALKSSLNPFYKSHYSDLASCWDACREPLSKNGLSVVQPAEVDEQGVVVTTMLMHTSGQWIRSSLRMIPKDGTPQSVGSGIAYGRRYGLTAMIGIAQIDDDGNAASGHSAERVRHDPRGDMGQNVATDKVQATVKHILGLLDEDIAGDHDGSKKAAIVMDYHEKVLNPDPDLYVAVGDALPTAKKNSWKAYVSQAKKIEAAEPKGRRF